MAAAIQANPDQERTATIRATADAILDFGLTYLPHYVRLAPSRLHRELCAELERIMASHDSERLAIAAPRGNAKSTWVSLIFVLFCIAFELKKFAIVVSNTSTLADSLVGDIAHELEENEKLAADFPNAVGRGPVWRQDQLVTRNGVMVLALGAGKRIRGRKWRQWRPDLIILDDLENDDHVRNIEQREKMYQWLNKAVLKAKGVAEKCDIVAVGTILHFDSMLARLCDPRKAPGWRSRIYRAVIQWSTSPLWEQWEALYCDWQKDDDRRMADAHAFYEAHREAMLAGTEVLWPEGEDYYALMRLRLDEGPTSFDSEKQNQPLDPSKSSFPEAWFTWFREQEIDGETWIVPEHGDAVRLADCDTFGALDPSMGKNDKHADPSCIATIACWPSTRIDRNARAYRKYFVLDAFIDRIHPHEQLRLLIELHRTRRYERFGIEAIQFQELFAENVEDAAVAAGLEDLSIRKLKPNSDKKLRIQKLGQFIYSARMVFSRKLSTLYDQLRYFPQHAHDDGPDGVELAMETAGAIGWTSLVDDVTDRTLLPDADQMQRGSVPTHVVPGDRCGGCTHFVARPGDPTRGFCKNVGMLTARDEVACEDFDVARKGPLVIEPPAALEDERGFPN